MGRSVPTYQRPHQSGFTLLEVLVAFVLMAVAVVVISQSFAGGLRNLARTDGYTTAALVADSQMVQVGIVYPVAEGEIDDTEVESEPESQLNEKYRWSISMSPYEIEMSDDQLDAPGEQQLFLVTVAVGWTEGGDERSFQLMSLKLGPKERGF